MKIQVAAFLFVALMAGIGAETRKSYAGYKTYRIVARDEAQAALLLPLKDDPRYDFWTFPRLAKRDIVVMVSPEAQSDFQRILTENNFDFSVLIDNIEESVEREMRSIRPRQPKGLEKISFDQYYPYDDIVAYVEGLATQYSSLVSVREIGSTDEGRQLIAARISSGDSGRVKPAIFMEAGIHAREWIAPEVALYIIYQLVEKYEENKDLLENVDWIIVPVSNPDGYEYTQSNDRFWRKNRHRNDQCRGVDVNRNFGYHWGEQGASDDPCDETFMGDKALSEKEANALSDLGGTQPIDLYIALHSYGPYLLYPWGYDYIKADDWKDLESLANQTADAIRKANKNYDFEVGNSAILLYAAAGGSDDHMKANNNIKYAYTMELPGGGSAGFNPPPKQIEPIVTAIWEGLKVCGKYISNLHK